MTPRTRGIERIDRGRPERASGGSSQRAVQRLAAAVEPAEQQERCRSPAAQSRPWRRAEADGGQAGRAGRAIHGVGSFESASSSESGGESDGLFEDRWVRPEGHVTTASSITAVFPRPKCSRSMLWEA